jgi:hypothetical protein
MPTAMVDSLNPTGATLALALAATSSLSPAHPALATAQAGQVGQVVELDPEIIAQPTAA